MNLHLSFPQAIGDGGQGWGNFILYVMVSGKVRNKLFSCCTGKSANDNLNHLEDRSSQNEVGGGDKVKYGKYGATTIQDTKPPVMKKGGLKNDVDTFEPTTS